MYKMFKKCGISASKVWRKLTVQKRDGSIVKIQIVDLPNELFEKFMDFKMEYYVKREIAHRAAGIPSNVNAMAEYRQYYTSIVKNNPNYAIRAFLSYPEQNGTTTMPEMVGMSILKLVKLNEMDYDTSQLKTKEMKRFFDISRKWINLYPLSDVMRAHGLETYYDDGGLAMRPDYYGYGLANIDGAVRLNICKEHGVPMTGAWMTSPYSAKAATNCGWESVFEISYDELSKKLRLTFENPPPKCFYMICKP